jgi:hypothetical protein
MSKRLVSAGFLIASLILIGAGCSPTPQPVPAPKPMPVPPRATTTDPYQAPTGKPVTGSEPGLFNPAQQ